MSGQVLVELTFPGLAAWVPLARRWVADALTTAGHRDMDDARLITSELVGNAVLHTGSGRPGGLVMVRVSEVGDAVARIEVIDEGAKTTSSARPVGWRGCAGQIGLRPGRPSRRAIQARTVRSKSCGRGSSQARPDHRRPAIAG